MRAGLRRHRITFQRPISATHARGDKTKSGVDYRTVWARINTTSGRDFLDVHQTESETTATITCCYIVGVKPYMRIKFEGRYFEIVHIINSDERSRDLQILVRELT